MPSIDIQVLENVFTEDEKARIIKNVTRAFGEIAGSTLEASTSVRIHEVRSGAWGYGGRVLTTDDARAMRGCG